jgi:citrate synthase
MSSPTAPGTEVHKGLEGVVAAETSVGDVDGARCQLIYRGYNIDELAGRATYEEVSYLLLEGALPTAAQLSGWVTQLDAQRTLEPATLALLQALPRSAGPMAMLRTAVSILGLDDSEARDDSPEAIRRKAVRTIALTPTIVAAIGRLRSGAVPLAPTAGLSQTANFLSMLHGTKPSEVRAQADDVRIALTPSFHETNL